MAKRLSDDTVLSLTDLIDRELRIRGTSLERWANQQGLMALDVVAMLEGLRRDIPSVRHALDETLGCSTRELVGAMA